jgi:hypothetical protein
MSSRQSLTEELSGMIFFYTTRETRASLKGMVDRHLASAGGDDVGRLGRKMDPIDIRSPNHLTVSFHAILLSIYASVQYGGTGMIGHMPELALCWILEHA